ncbi:hypothetical protein OAF54_00810, partial [bacterium]|nr:hypothetical protein [bacterium]
LLLALSTIRMLRLDKEELTDKIYYMESSHRVQVQSLQDKIDSRQGMFDEALDKKLDEYK